MKKNIRFHGGSSGAALAVHITPRARRNEIVEFSVDGSIKIRLRSPNEAGELNASLVAYLAKVLKIKPGNIEVVAGADSLSKLVSVIGLDAEDAQKRILEKLG